MRRKKAQPDEPRLCSKCNAEESAEHPFPPKGYRCKRCEQDYNTAYQRARRGHKSRDEKLSPEERHQHKLDSNKRWRANNPDKAKESDKKAGDKRYAENGDTIRQRNSDWQKTNLAWRREYNKQRRDV